MTALADLNKMIVPEKFEEFKQYLQSRRDMLLLKDKDAIEKLNVRQTVGDVKNADGSFDITKVKLPEYNFEKHKGYGTKAHREVLIEIGPCKYHRKSFLKKILNN